MKITRLVCRGCGSPLSGLGTDCVFICSTCGRCFAGGGKGLEPLSVEHRALPGSGIPLPFWRVSAAVHVLKRTVRNEFTTTILRFGSMFDSDTLPGKHRDTGGSSERREFLFPAFPVDGLPGIGVNLSRCLESVPPVIDGASGFPNVSGGSVSPEDALVLARCVAVGEETDKSDWLAEIELVISAARSSVVVLPCFPRGEKVLIGETGVSFFRRAVPRWSDILEYIGPQT